MTDPVAYWVAYPCALSVVPMTDPEFGTMNFDEQSNVPNFFG